MYRDLSAFNIAYNFKISIDEQREIYKDLSLYIYQFKCSIYFFFLSSNFIFIARGVSSSLLGALLIEKRIFFSFLKYTFLKLYI